MALLLEATADSLAAPAMAAPALRTTLVLYKRRIYFFLRKYFLWIGKKERKGDEQWE
jgi:hypothetical protein